MSFADNAALQTNIANWLARDDLTVYIPDFITLFECAAARRLKVRPQETSVTLTVTNGIATLPSDYLGYRQVTWTGSPVRDLSYITPPVWVANYGNGTQGVPSEFTIEGNSLKVGPLDNTSLTFDYFQRTPALSSGLNWLYTSHPDAYLFGSLAEANAFNKAVDPAGLWKARRDEVFSEITMLDFNERQGMSMRIMGCTP